MNLESYHTIRTALAADQLAPIADAATKLSTASDIAIAKASALLARAKDLASARRAFGDLSRAILATATGPAFVFECSMAKPYGRWLQEKKEIGNPYYGSAMLRCGRLIETRAP